MLLNVQIKQYSEHLECGGHFTEELIPKICLKYENASDTKFSQWATTNLYEPALKQVKDLRVMTKQALGYTPLTVETLCRMTNTRYDDAIATGRYTTAVVTKEPDALPAGYLAKIQEEVTKSLRQVQFGDKSAKGTGGGGTRGTGEGTDGDKDLSVITVNGTEYPYKSNTWKSQAPLDPKPLRFVMGPNVIGIAPIANAGVTTMVVRTIKSISFAKPGLLLLLLLLHHQLTLRFLRRRPTSPWSQPPVPPTTGTGASRV